MKSLSILRYRALRHARRSHLRGPQYRSIELGNAMFGHSRGMFKVERSGEWQEAFWKMLNGAGFDHYGNYGYDDDGNKIEDAPHRDCVKKCPNKRRDFGFENDTFVIRPYYWGGNSRAARRPNFVFKPTGYQMKWYKYPLRDAYANRDLSLDEFKAMLSVCAASLAPETQQNPKRL